jgi:hypothetical protein
MVAQRLRNKRGTKWAEFFLLTKCNAFMTSRTAGCLSINVHIKAHQGSW